MSEYKVPDSYFFPLRHIRPRFKNDVENVLDYIAFGIMTIGALPVKEFNAALDKHIHSYGDNVCSTDKTVANWRTEISALFGLYIEEKGFCTPTSISEDLANHSNLTRFFRNFIFSFQYPGGHLKPLTIEDIIKQGILFHPGRWVCDYFLNSKQKYLTKEEFCHCVLNDLRVTRDHEDLCKTIRRINKNREEGIVYDGHGDMVRYAGDILDYMVLGDLLQVDSNGRYLKRDRSVFIMRLIMQSKKEFNKYQVGDICQISELEPLWFHYVDDCYREFSQMVENLPMLDMSDGADDNFGADDTNEDGAKKKIGDWGENLTLAHEKLRVGKGGREDLVHLIKRIPTHLAAGFDIKSIEIDTLEDRMIEVKTTISKTPLSFNRFHLTTNEWRVAETLGDHYYVYRLQISDSGYKLFLIQNPVKKYKMDILKMIPRDGADVVFAENAGEFAELLCKH